jgi:hypothetical protein
LRILKQRRKGGIKKEQPIIIQYNVKQFLQRKGRYHDKKITVDCYRNRDAGAGQQCRVVYDPGKSGN